jgi:hypothetical protein
MVNSLQVPAKVSEPATGLHEDLARSHESETGSDRSFGLFLFVFFLAIGVWPVLFRRAGFPAGLRLWALYVSAGALLVSVAAPRILHPLNVGMSRLGLLIAKITNPLLMGVLFYFVFAPMGFLFRLMGKDSLRLRPEPGAGTYWIFRQPPGPPPDSMANQF